jgi:hypothetical protein
MSCGFPYCGGVDCADCHKPRCTAIEYCNEWPNCNPACPLSNPSACGCDSRAAAWGLVKPSSFHYEDCTLRNAGVDVPLPPSSEPVKRWRFHVTDFDDNVHWLDANGGPDGDEKEAEFIGTGNEAIAEGDRRSDLWERRTGGLAAKITRESRGLAHGVRVARIVQCAGCGEGVVPGEGACRRKRGHERPTDCAHGVRVAHPLTEPTDAEVDAALVAHGLRVVPQSRADMRRALTRFVLSRNAGVQEVGRG